MTRHANCHDGTHLITKNIFKKQRKNQHQQNVRDTRLHTCKEKTTLWINFRAILERGHTCDSLISGTSRHCTMFYILRVLP